jgi:hypothetical protein
MVHKSTSYRDRMTSITATVTKTEAAAFAAIAGADHMTRSAHLTKIVRDVVAAAPAPLAGQLDLFLAPFPDDVSTPAPAVSPLASPGAPALVINRVVSFRKGRVNP